MSRGNGTSSRVGAGGGRRHGGRAGRAGRAGWLLVGRPGPSRGVIVRRRRPPWPWPTPRSAAILPTVYWPNVPLVAIPPGTIGRLSYLYGHDHGLVGNARVVNVIDVGTADTLRPGGYDRRRPARPVGDGDGWRPLHRSSPRWTLPDRRNGPGARWPTRSTTRSCSWPRADPERVQVFVDSTIPRHPAPAECTRPTSRRAAGSWRRPPAPAGWPPPKASSPPCAACGLGAAAVVGPNTGLIRRRPGSGRLRAWNPPGERDDFPAVVATLAGRTSPRPAWSWDLARPGPA